MGNRKPSSVVRRYPALGFIIAAAALAILLPSALNVPQSGPSTLAEFAPVPGSGQGTSNVSDLGQAGSGGIGFGSSKETSQASLPAELGTLAAQKRAKLKSCVGNPARQTEDLLSPPCVAFFEGDNGGVTAKGVTRDEVAVVMYVGGDANTDSDFRRVIDCATVPDSSDNGRNLACAAYMRYFNSRYQTYNRIVHLYANHAAPHADYDAQYKPFATVATDILADKKTLGVLYDSQYRKRYQDKAPYMIGFRADVEDQARISASYVCLKLKGRLAQYAGDPLLKERTRKFGIFHDSQDGWNLLGPEIRSQCDLNVTVYSNQSGSAQATTTNLAQFKQDNVTTVMPILSRIALVQATNIATNLGYFPEWALPGSRDLGGPDKNVEARFANPAQWGSAFGITFDYRRDSIPEQNWYRAYKEGCPRCAEPATSAGGGSVAELYDQLTMLFYGIQAGGPRLSAESIDKGLHAIPPNGSPSPYKPAAYFSTGNYTFLKDATAIWWDQSGTPPGSQTAGCYRLLQEGKRYRNGEWTTGDADVRSQGPCQGDVRIT